MNIIHTVLRIPRTLSQDLRRTESEADDFLPYSVGGILHGPIPPLPREYVWGGASLITEKIIIITELNYNAHGAGEHTARSQHHRLTHNVTIPSDI